MCLGERKRERQTDRQINRQTATETVVQRDKDRARDRESLSGYKRKVSTNNPQTGKRENSVPIERKVPL